jgi:hypothetical protein
MFVFFDNDNSFSHKTAKKLGQDGHKTRGARQGGPAPPAPAESVDTKVDSPWTAVAQLLPWNQLISYTGTKKTGAGADTE